MHEQKVTYYLTVHIIQEKIIKISIFYYKLLSIVLIWFASKVNNQCLTGNRKLKNDFYVISKINSKKWI